MEIKYTFTCPSCERVYSDPFIGKCESCEFHTGGLTGKITSGFQKKKWNKHTELLHGTEISIPSGHFNASFDSNAVENIDKIVNYTITFGEDVMVPMGPNNFKARFVYIPEIIGSGTAYHYAGNVPVSGCCLLSPANLEMGHSFPTVTEWVSKRFSGNSKCRICEKPTGFGIAFCHECYLGNKINWKDTV
jgi:hypothetical protein